MWRFDDSFIFLHLIFSEHHIVSLCGAYRTLVITYSKWNSIGESSFSFRRSLFTRLTCATPTQMLSMPMFVWLENTSWRCGAWESAAHALSCRIQGMRQRRRHLRIDSPRCECVCGAHKRNSGDNFVFLSTFARPFCVQLPKKPIRDISFSTAYFSIYIQPHDNSVLCLFATKSLLWHAEKGKSEWNSFQPHRETCAFGLAAISMFISALTVWMMLLFWLCLLVLFEAMLERTRTDKIVEHTLFLSLRVFPILFIALSMDG